MNASTIRRTIRGEDGFVLATVLLFLIVLSLTAFFAAGMTRTDIQVVNNLQNEKEALAIAEAGVQEALYRLSLAGSGAVTATVNGINGGSAFNPSIAPQVPGRDSSHGASPYGPVHTAIASTTQILFHASAPASGSNNTTPSLQPIASRLPYSSGTADTGTIDFDTTANLTVGWDLCTATDAATGCAGGANTIRQLPLSVPRYVVKIVSTGRSGAARRRVTVRAVDTDGNNPAPPPPRMLTLGTDCNQGITMTGSTSLTAEGPIQVNGGAAWTSSPPCVSISTGGARSSISASAVGVSGNYTGNVTPQPQTGTLPETDPLAGMLAPCFGLNVTNCQPVGTPTVQNHVLNPNLPSSCIGTAAAPVHCSVSSVTLDPGIYYGGLSISGDTVLNPGLYIMAGSGLSGGDHVSFEAQTGNTGATTTGVDGVTIYTTQNDNPLARSGDGQFGSFSLGSGNASAGLVASTGGYYQGITLFQDRANTLSVDLTGGSSGSYTLDGIFYAPSAALNLSGHTNETIGGNLIVLGPINLSGGSNITIGNATTPCGAACGPPGGILYTPIAWQDF